MFAIDSSLPGRLHRGHSATRASASQTVHTRSSRPSPYASHHARYQSRWLKGIGSSAASASHAGPISSSARASSIHLTWHPTAR